MGPCQVLLGVVYLYVFSKKSLVPTFITFGCSGHSKFFRFQRNVAMMRGTPIVAFFQLVHHVF